MIKKIPVYQPVLGPSVRRNVLECIDSNWISSRGNFIDKFEMEFSDRIGVNHSATVSNGTVALHLALLGLGIQPGDEVIVPSFTYIASVNAIAYMGAVPVFVDVLEATWQIDPDDIKRKISPKTKAIMAVHLYGHPADMASIMSIASKYNLLVVEDAAEAFGSYIGDRHVGTFGDVSTFSFFGNKTITTGEGGMVATNNPTIDARVRKLKGQGLEGSREYWHDEVGYNYRMTNICAAIGLAQLEDVEKLLARKREIARIYSKSFAKLPLKFLWEQDGVTNSFWMNSILLDDGLKREALRQALTVAGIETRPGFYPAHTMPMYSKYSQNKYPVSESLSARVINLPSSPALSDEDLVYITDSIRDFFGNLKAIQ